MLRKEICLQDTLRSYLGREDNINLVTIISNFGSSTWGFDRMLQSSCCGSVGLRSRPVSMKMQVQSLASLNGLRIGIARSRLLLGTSVAGCGKGLSCSSNSTPSSGTSMCCRCSYKKKKREREKKCSIHYSPGRRWQWDSSMWSRRWLGGSRCFSKILQTWCWTIVKQGKSYRIKCLEDSGLN